MKGKNISGIVQDEIKKRHPIAQMIIDFSEHILNFVWYLLIGLMIGYLTHLGLMIGPLSPRPTRHET